MKILITGGCSYTGGGGFNNPVVFKHEFNPTIIDNTNIDNLDWNDKNFVKIVKKHLWPEKLKQLTNHDIVYNCSVGAHGPFSTLSFLKESLLNFIEQYPNSKIDLIYQIPESAREEIWYEEYNRPVCILTNFDDDSEVKKNYYSNFFNDEYSFFKQINELVIFKKLCNLLNINLHLFCWDNKFIENSYEIEKLKKKILQDSHTDNNKFWTYLIGNVEDLERISIDKKIEFLNVLEFEGTGIADYGQKKCSKFSFRDKYEKFGIDDSHASKEGMDFIAKTLFEKIFK